MSAWSPDSVDALTWTPEMVTFAGRAAELGLPFAPRVELGDDLDIPAEAVRRGSVARGAGGTLYIAPVAGKLPAIGGWLRHHPDHVARLAVATPSELRRAMMAAGAQDFADHATTALSRKFPEMSARKIMRPRQALAIVLIVAAALAAVVFDPAGAAAVIGFVATLFFLTISILRFTAASVLQRNGLPKPAPVARVPDDKLPVYTVLVPLFREAAVVKSVVAALRRLDWPGIR